MKRIKIAEGISLNLIASDKFKTNYLGFNFVLPLDKETASKASLLPGVLLLGNADYPDMLSFNRRLETLYSAGISGSTAKNDGERLFLKFSASFIRDEFTPEDSDVLESVTGLLIGTLFRPLLENGAFKKEYVEGEKKKLCDRIKAEINNKGSYANKRLFELMCEGEPYAVSASGEAAEVEKITPEALYDFYTHEFAKAPVEIFFVGVCDEEKTVASFRRILSPYAREGMRENTAKLLPAVREVRRVCEEMPVNQGKLAIGFRTGKSFDDLCEGASLRVFNELYGGSPTSKLFMNVREKLSLCYYCSSRILPAKGMMLVASGVKVGNEEAAEKEILAQLGSTASGDFTEEDILDAKRSLVNAYETLSDDVPALCSWHLGCIASGYAERTPESLIEAIGKVTKEDIVAIASLVKQDTVYFLKGTNLEEEEDGEDAE